MSTFDIIVKLFLISLIPVAVSIGMRALLHYTKLHDLKFIYKQIIVGVIFGIISVLGTVFGIETTSKAIINIRDVPPICAALIFGGPSGIIAGLIGGGYRYFSVFFGLSGAYTQVACSISTVCAGLFSAIIRRFVFDKHHGKWYYGFGIGALCESFHMLMVFFTHMDDIEKAYNAVINCALPMILVNSFAVMVALIGVAIVSKEKLLENKRPMEVSSIIQIGLLGSLTIAFLTITFFTQAALKNIRETTTTELLSVSVDDVKHDVDDQINRNLYNLTIQIQTDVNAMIVNNVDFDDMIPILMEKYSLTELSFINTKNYIKNSSRPDYVGFNMSSGEQSNEFAVLLRHTNVYVQDYQPITKNSSVNMKYAGAQVKANDSNISYFQIGYDKDAYHALLDGIIEFSVTFRHVGNDGYMIICDDTGVILSKYAGFQLAKVDNIQELKLNATNEYTIQLDKETSTDIYYYAVTVEGYYIVAGANKATCDLDTNITSLVITMTELFVFLTMYCIIYVIIKKFVVNSVLHVKHSLNEISDGNLDVVVNEKSSYEFESLSIDINKTVDTLKEFIEKESKKIDEELRFAKSIQESSLPKNFPAFPQIKEIDLYACMKTAKEVGGDFYDFYKVGQNKVAILIADVSGKGIPAAMFMMKAKSIIKGLAENGLSVEEVFTEANKRLCEENEAQMFVTAWLAFVDFTNGHMEFVNAGHNAPLLMQNGEFTYLKSKAGFVLAGIDTIKYKKNELDLLPGDKIYLYTDGVTEAMNIEKKLYGEDRLSIYLNSNKDLNPTDMCNGILGDVEQYTEGEPQSDDITMLSFVYYGNEEK